MVADPRALTMSDRGLQFRAVIDTAKALERDKSWREALVADACLLGRRGVEHQNVNAKGAVCTEHDRLLDVARSRRSGNQVDRARNAAAFLADEHEGVLHRVDNALRGNDSDVRIRQ